MQADFNLSYAQLGLLPALYMAGLMVSCLVFNELTNHVNSFRLVGEAREAFLKSLQWQWRHKRKTCSRVAMP